MTITTVFWADWAIECCGTPFSVGDQVEWDLHLTEYEAGDERAYGSSLTTVDGITGVLSAGTHSLGHPVGPVTARVRRIHVLIRGWTETVPGSGTFRTLPGEHDLRTVRTCPKWFRQVLDGTHRILPGGAEYRRGETGVLVELESAH